MASDPLAAFAAEVGPPEAGPVTCAGGRTDWEVGGRPDPSAREVRAPTGIVAHTPAEMVVRCRAGTPVEELAAALAERGQRVALPVRPGATVGGVLAVGRSAITRLGHGPVRDAVLEVRYVSAAGRLVKAGGPVVKNVSGYDLCRLMVGSLGTLGFIAEVVLRCWPLPAAAQWFVGTGADPFAVQADLWRPAAVLWDGTTTWVLLEGHPADVAEQARLLGPTFAEAAGPPQIPAGGRLSLRPAALRGLDPGAWGGWLAEVGVGVVHTAGPAPAPAVDAGVAALCERVKRAFDPAGRLNPGRRVLP
jgi:glycolate oxidase FAD binding subunit